MDSAWIRDELYGEYNIENYGKTVKKVLYCVTPTREVLAHFYRHEYDLLISHHPFLVPVPQLIFHTALDCCEAGLNDQWRDHIGLHVPYRHFDGTLGWYGEIDPIPFPLLCQRVKQLSNHIDGETWSVDPNFVVKTVVICSGLGGAVNEQALSTQADCYIIGENVMQAQHTGFSAVIETGHTNSEWMGVRLFQRILKGVQVDLAPQSIDYYGKEVRRQRGIR